MNSPCGQRFVLLQVHAGKSRDSAAAECWPHTDSGCYSGHLLSQSVGSTAPAAIHPLLSQPLGARSDPVLCPSGPTKGGSSCRSLHLSHSCWTFTDPDEPVSEVTVPIPQEAESHPPTRRRRTRSCRPWEARMSQGDRQAELLSLVVCCGFYRQHVSPGGKPSTTQASSCRSVRAVGTETPGHSGGQSLPFSCVHGNPTRDSGPQADGPTPEPNRPGLTDSLQSTSSPEAPTGVKVAFREGIYAYEGGAVIRANSCLRDSSARRAGPPLLQTWLSPVRSPVWSPVLSGWAASLCSPEPCPQAQEGAGASFASCSLSLRPLWGSVHN
ncbi:uncharacterized protein WM277_001124 isoform 2-T2 [Molossus nigricans]